MWKCKTYKYKYVLSSLSFTTNMSASELNYKLVLHVCVCVFHHSTRFMAAIIKFKDWHPLARNSSNYEGSILTSNRACYVLWDMSWQHIASNSPGPCIASIPLEDSWAEVSFTVIAAVNSTLWPFDTYPVFASGRERGEVLPAVDFWHWDWCFWKNKHAYNVSLWLIKFKMFLNARECVM